jgi:outer membrane receptor protein involved in Fe transport
MGDLTFSGNINKYLTQESQSSDTTPVLDCKGFYGTSCDPISDLRWVQRTTWNWNDLTVSARWRHIDSVDVEPGERDLRFPAFRSIDSYDYIDLFASYDVTENVRVSAGIDNVFDEDPPVVGNDVGDTSSNSGNTFPGNYDTLGRIYRASVNFRF